jgi:hypothetical protein
MNEKIENLKKTFLYFYSGAFVGKSLTEFNKAKEVDHTRRILFLKKVNELFRYFRTQSFKTQSFKTFNKQEEFIDFFKSERMRKLVEAAVAGDPVHYTMGTEKAGVLSPELDEVVESWKRTGKQYGVMAENAYVRPYALAPRHTDDEKFPEIEVQQRKFYVKNLSELEAWAEAVEPEYYNKFIKGKES